MPPLKDLRPEALTLIHEDAALVAVDKPAGLLVHRGWSRCDDVVLIDLLRARLGRPVWPIHRLDRATSGVMVLGLDLEATRALGAQFEQREVTKHYLALTRGEAPARCWIDHPVPRAPGEERVGAVSFARRLAVAATEPRHASLLELIPRTGRLHQLRRHLKHISHPIIGDSNYGRGALNRAMQAGYGLDRLALHAFALTLRHPTSGEALTLRAPMPASLGEPLGRMGIEASAWEAVIGAPSSAWADPGAFAPEERLGSGHDAA